MRRGRQLIGYITAVILFFSGVLYLLSTLIAILYFSMSLTFLDYMGIVLWLGIFWVGGILLILYLRRPAVFSRKKRHKKEKIQQKPEIKKEIISIIHEEREETIFTKPALQEKKERSVPPLNKPAIVTSKELNLLKIEYTVGEITKEEYERRKKELLSK